MAKRSKARVCGRWLAGIAGSNPARGMDVCGVRCTVRTKGKARTIRTKEQVRIKYKERTRIKKIKNPGGGKVRFFAPVQTGPGTHPASNTRGTGLFPGGKAVGAWR